MSDSVAAAGSSNKSDDKGSNGKASLLERLGSEVESRMQKFFYWVGYTAGTKPWRMLAGCLVFAAIGLFGISFMENETRGDKLWAPAGTNSQASLTRYDTYFPTREARVERAIFTSSAGGDGADMLTSTNLQLAMTQFNSIKEMVSTAEGQDYQLIDICSKDFSNGYDCLVSSVFEKWDYSLATLEADTNPLQTILSGSSEEQLLEYLGGTVLDSDGDIASASALKIQFYVENNEEIKGGEYVDVVAEAWEEDFIELLQDECEEGLTCFINATRSEEDAFGDAIVGDLTLVSLSYLIIISYLMLQLSGKPLRRSRIALSGSALLIVGLSIGWSIGMGSMLGFFYTPLHSLLPFILLGLGVDDAFVIVNAYSQTSVYEPIEMRLAHALSHSGVSITVTSLTDFVAFFVSSTSSLPALQSFCVHCSCGIFALYVLSATAFSCFLCFDERRREGRRSDVLCCLKNPSQPVPSDIAPGEYDQGDPRDSKIGKFLGGVYGPALTKKAVKVAVLLAFAGLLAFGILGATQLSVEDPSDAFIPRYHYAWAYREAEDEYFSSVGTRFDVITETFDYFEQQADVLAVRDSFSGKETSPPYVKDPETSGTFTSWQNDFVDWAISTTSAATATDGEYTVLTDEDEYFQLLHTYLEGDGKQYNSSVVFESYGSIRATKIGLQYSSYINNNAGRQVKALHTTEDLVSSLPFDAFPFTFVYLQWESFDILLQELYVGLAASLATVFLVCLVLIAEPLTAGLVFVAVLLTIIDQLGIIYYWGLAIDNVAVINLVLAIGLSVDYSAHIGHSFMLQTGTRDERMVGALSDIGVAVLNGGISTFLAVLSLSGSKSYVFQTFFKQFFVTVVVGLGHGLIFLPVVLSLIGPRAYKSARDAAETAAAVSPTGAVAGGAEGLEQQQQENARLEDKTKTSWVPSILRRKRQVIDQQQPDGTGQADRNGREWGAKGNTPSPASNGSSKKVYMHAEEEEGVGGGQVSEPPAAEPPAAEPPAAEPPENGMVADQSQGEGEGEGEGEDEGLPQEEGPGEGEGEGVSAEASPPSPHPE